MVSDRYVNRIRQARDHSSVVKLRLISTRERNRNRTILVFEGDDDKVVYGRWITRLAPDMRYVAFVCKGKDRVRDLSNSLVNDLNGLAAGVFLMVDKDFDELLGFLDNPALFMTDRYSVENYLVSENVVRSLLRDEFPLHDDAELCERLVQQFVQDYGKFLEVTREFNRRLFVARRLGISMTQSLPDKLSEFADVAIGSVTTGLYAPEDRVCYARSPSPDELNACNAEFELLDPDRHYRGKNSYLFFAKWLDMLCCDCDGGTGMFANVLVSGRARRNELVLGTFAAKSSMPDNIEQFVAKMAA